ncbi:MAG: nitroreductase family protein [Candidatus Omnitrophica bacterium]|nr:nitroreductase family protein [Candidatus Omnitrophota bacterium]
MDLIELIKKRRSVREFLNKPISRDCLEDIVDAARFAPTARNVQPWEFVVVTEKEALKHIAEISEHGKFISSAAASILVFSQDTKYFLEDCSAATQNAMLAALALGIGSCWVAGDKKSYAGELNLLFGVPISHKLVSIIALGYPVTDKVFRAADKRSLQEVLHWERF